MSTQKFIELPCIDYIKKMVKINVEFIESYRPSDYNGEIYLNTNINMASGLFYKIAMPVSDFEKILNDY